MKPSIGASLCLAALLAGSPAGAGAPGFCSDPLVTHTNGMRLASSTSTRSHNVYWQCEAGHVGYCDGCLRSPCRDSWRSLGTRPGGKYRPPYTPMGPTSDERPYSVDGLEHASSESLGTLGGAPVGVAAGNAAAGPTLAGPGPAATTATGPAQSAAPWLDAIQTIGRKMIGDGG